MGLVIWLTLLSIPFVYYGTHKTENVYEKDFVADIAFKNKDGKDTAITVNGVVVEKRRTITKNIKDGKE